VLLAVFSKLAVGLPEDDVEFGAPGVDVAEPEPPTGSFCPGTGEFVPERFVPLPRAVRPVLEAMALEVALKVCWF
jgi:hypothetical protein